MTRPRENAFDYQRSASYHLTLWHNILAECLGWSEEETLAWATSQGWLECLKNPLDWIYHEPPHFCLVAALTPQSLSYLEGEEWITYLQKMREAVGSWDELPQGGNHYRTRVAEVLSEYGASLPIHQTSS